MMTMSSHDVARHSTSREVVARARALRTTYRRRMFATRVSSFAVGFAVASAGSFYVIREDIRKNHQTLADECRDLVARVRALEAKVK